MAKGLQNIKENNNIVEWSRQVEKRTPAEGVESAAKEFSVRRSSAIL
ncbi:hypothetical protein [Ruminococcus sp.]